MGVLLGQPGNTTSVPSANGLVLFAVSGTGQYLYATSGQNIYISNNGGSSFTSVSLAPMYPYRPAISDSGQYVYTTNPGSSYYAISSNYGQSFTQYTISGTNIPRIICSANGSIVYFSDYNTGKLYISTDYGQSFPTTVNVTSDALWVASTPPDGSIVYMINQGLAEVYSYNRLTSTLTTYPGGNSNYKDYLTTSDSGQYIYFGTYTGAYRSINGGTSFSLISGLNSSHFFLYFACDPTGQYVYTVDNTTNIFWYSSDFGATWNSGSYTGLGGVFVNRTYNSLILYGTTNYLSSAPIITAPILYSNFTGNIRPRSSNGQLTFDWYTPTSDGGSPITGYYLSSISGNDSNSPYTFGSNVFNTTISGLSNGVDYTYVIAASNGNGLGPAAQYRTVEPGVNPSIPSTLSLSSINTSTVITNWTPPLSNGGANIKWYLITAKPLDNAVSTIRLSAYGYDTSRTISGLNPTKEYSISVAAVNNPGYSPYISTMYNISIWNLYGISSPDNQTLLAYQEGGWTNTWGFSKQSFLPPYYVSFSSKPLTGQGVFGITSNAYYITPSVAPWLALNNGFGFYNAGGFVIQEDSNGSLFSGTYSYTDIFKINVSTSNITYYKNETLIYTSLKAPPTIPYYVAGTMLSPGDSITNIQFGATPFNPSDLPNLLIWLDMADSNAFTTSSGSINSMIDKSGNGNTMNQIAPNSTEVPFTSIFPVPGTAINGLTTAYFSAPAGIKMTGSARLNGVTNFFWVGRQGDQIGPSFFLGDDINYDWHGQTTIYACPPFTQPGIYNATTTIFTNNTSTTGAFSSITVVSTTRTFMISANGITGNTRFQGLCYDRTTQVGWIGDFGELICYNSALTSGQISTVNSYLRNKWNI